MDWYVLKNEFTWPKFSYSKQWTQEPLNQKRKETLKNSFSFCLLTDVCMWEGVTNWSWRQTECREETILSEDNSKSNCNDDNLQRIFGRRGLAIFKISDYKLLQKKLIWFACCLFLCLLFILCYYLSNLCFGSFENTEWVLTGKDKSYLSFWLQEVTAWSNSFHMCVCRRGSYLISMQPHPVKCLDTSASLKLFLTPATKLPGKKRNSHGVVQ